MARAHPHTRGDDGVRVEGSMYAGGSPPHAWGRPPTQPLTDDTWRLTPTRVGTTASCWPTRTARRAHPHTRGDDSMTAMISAHTRGSPPHAWGRRRVERLARQAWRLTPTRVGTTLPHARHYRAGRAHPHTRGDDSSSRPPLSGWAGSPPHAWGRRRQPREAQESRRLTPTRVGTTCRPHPMCCLRRAHPHTRGDDSPG